MNLVEKYIQVDKERKEKRAKEQDQNALTRGFHTISNDVQMFMTRRDGTQVPLGAMQSIQANGFESGVVETNESFLARPRELSMNGTLNNATISTSALRQMFGLDVD